MLLISWQFTSNISSGIQRHDTVTRDFALSVIKELPQESILVCFEEFYCTALMYVQTIEGIRSDVHLISAQHIQTDVSDNDLWGFSNQDNPYFIADVVSWNIFKGRRVFLTDIPDFYIKYLGLEGDPFFLHPKRYVFEVTKKLPLHVDGYTYTVSETLISIPKSKNYWKSSIRDSFANFHTLSGTIYSHLNMRQEARKNYQLALKLNPNQPVAYELNAGLSGYEGNPLYHLGSESTSSAYFIKQGTGKIAQKRFKEAYDDLRKAVLVDPLDKQARILLAGLLQDQGYFTQAEGEYRNILKYYPDDAVIEQRLQAIISKKK